MDAAPNGSETIGNGVFIADLQDQNYLAFPISSFEYWSDNNDIWIPSKTNSPLSVNTMSSSSSSSASPPSPFWEPHAMPSSFVPADYLKSLPESEIWTTTPLSMHVQTDTMDVIEQLCSTASTSEDPDQTSEFHAHPELSSRVDAINVANLDISMIRNHKTKSRLSPLQSTGGIPFPLLGMPPGPMSPFIPPIPPMLIPFINGWWNFLFGRIPFLPPGFPPVPPLLFLMYHQICFGSPGDPLVQPQDLDPTMKHRKMVSVNFARPSPSYRCHRCDKPGHYVELCPDKPTNPRTPYQGDKVSQGFFCCKCENFWHSNNARRNVWQKCHLCERPCYPFKMKPLLC